MTIESGGNESGGPRPVDEVVAAVRTWPGVTVGPHRFDAVEFALGGHEVGHVHRSGALDVPAELDEFGVDERVRAVFGEVLGRGESAGSADADPA